jgi:hypothetical protein
MRIENNPTYNGLYVIPISKADIIDPSSQNGKTIAASTAQNSNFWLSTLGFGAAWNCGGVVSRGHPALANVVNPGLQ